MPDDPALEARPRLSPILALERASRFPDWTGITTATSSILSTLIVAAKALRRANSSLLKTARLADGGFSCSESFVVSVLSMGLSPTSFMSPWSTLEEWPRLVSPAELSDESSRLIGAAGVPAGIEDVPAASWGLWGIPLDPSAPPAPPGGGGTLNPETFPRNRAQSPPRTDGLGSAFGDDVFGPSPRPPLLRASTGDGVCRLNALLLSFDIVVGCSRFASMYEFRNTR